MKQLILVALLFTLVGTSSANAQVTASELTLGAQVFNDPTHRQWLFFRSKVRLNAEIDRACSVRLYGSVSKIGNIAATPKRRLIAGTRVTRGDKPRVVFEYLGQAVTGSQSEQTQLNLQARVSCKNQAIITTDALATNITCQRGVKRKNFMKNLQKYIVIK